MGKIIFYEGRNYQGRSWECSGDCSDTFSHFTCCNSMRVMGGHWVAYEKPNFMGYQYMLNKGEYPEFSHWMGFNNCIRSCQMISPYRGAYRMRIYNRPNLSGNMMEFMEDCPNAYHQLRAPETSTAPRLRGY
ncbi:hypothetical protein AALO_G00218680 [Alosa alosa]|uniref:Beta/gamma crystallin 'Greek key' domain-containing protein n=2 Tax=Alosa alosa TaxID=278164 RepID=A0AAV6FX82_9TELE|nr:hypothetical protein AALO_G00218680 [Alosa alosa]